MNITPEQLQLIVDNILWIVPSILFTFVSLVLGFWKLIGKFFVKSNTKDIPQESLSSEVSQQVPQIPVENETAGAYVYNKKDYVELK